MELHLPTETYEAIKKAKPKSPILKGEKPYHSIDVDTKFLDAGDLALILDIVSKPPFSDDIRNRRVRIKLRALSSIGDKDRKEVKVKKLELLEHVLREVIDASSPRKWIYRLDKKLGVILPHFVSSIEYHPRSDFTAPHVSISLESLVRGGGDDNEKLDQGIHIGASDLPSTVKEIFGKREVLLETDELFHEYEADLARYREICTKTGSQFWARGFGYKVESRSAAHSFERDSRPAKTVMDDLLDRGSEAEFVATKYWDKKHSDDDDNEVAMRIPLLPIARVFDLRTHFYVDTHVSNLEVYEYDEKMAAKLVLPGDHRELMDALTDQAVEKMDDIVRGKAAGIIIVCSGPPGSGKTLTAEVYSETVKRPLYTVQCSQLGTEPTGDEGLEKQLNDVLERATRWNAVLLIDEADVYVQERGRSLNQNAVVGVFLRVLEYYAGILFLTTNRATEIDDAIMSRATAHVRYGVLGDGEADKRRRLWEVLLEQYKIDSVNVEDAVNRFPQLSGRSIRQLIKLASVMAKRRGTKVSVDTLLWAAKFHDFSENEKANLL